jgi:hypothetical protein
MAKHVENHVGIIVRKSYSLNGFTVFIPVWVDDNKHGLYDIPSEKCDFHWCIGDIVMIEEYALGDRCILNVTEVLNR